MSTDVSEGVAQMGKLYVHIAENGHSVELDCDQDTLVETVQKRLQSDTRIHLIEQLLLCLDMKLEPQQPLSVYKLPSNDREVFLFNKAKMRTNSPPPAPEQVEIVDIPDPPLPSASHHSHDPHPLDDATDPALKALPSYERQFRYHFQQGNAIYNRSLAMLEVCHKLFREQKVQERALEIARGNLDHFYRMINQNYKDFMNYYLQQRRSHSHLLLNFGRYMERLRSCKILPVLQIPNRKCLLDFLKEEHLRKLVGDFNSSHKQFENKVSEFKQEFGDLERNAEHLFSSKASSLIKELEVTIKDHQRHINEQKSIMQALSKDVNTVKKLVDDCLCSQLSSSLRPHDAVSALGPMYDGHDKSYLPRMQTCERSIFELLGSCRDKKNEMNIFVHNYMQKMAYIQYTIKDLRFKFSVFQEALKRQSDQFEQLKVVRGIGPAYRACLAEIVRRKSTMKLFMGMAGQLAERLATKREDEVKRREDFLKLHGLFIPRDVLASMGLYDTPSQCSVDIAPFDMNLLDIDISDIDRYGPESLFGQSFRSEKQGTSKGSNLMSNDSNQSAETGGSSVDFHEKCDSEELLEDLEFIDIAGTSKIEVENAKLKAELATKIAIICSLCPEFDSESFDDSKLDSFMEEAAEKTSEALRLKDEYEKQLHSLVKTKQRQCESYERRIQELEHRLGEQHQQRLSTDEDVSNVSHAVVKTDESVSDMSGANVQILHAAHAVMSEISCASSSLNAKEGIISGQERGLDGLDGNMSDLSGTLNTQLDSSMRDPHRDEGHLCSIDKKDASQEEEVALGNSSMAVSISQPHASCSKTAAESELESKVLELESAYTEKTNQLNDAEDKLKDLSEETARLGRELEISHKLLDESQMNCAHLENCLHEAREEAQTHLCAAERRASEYGALRSSVVKMRGLFERLRNCILSGSVAGLGESLQALAHSLASSTNEMEDGAAELRECVHILSEKVGVLSRNRAELLERFSKAEKELEEKKELVATLFRKHQHEKQTNKERISFGRLEVHEIAAFVLNSLGHYEAVNRNCPYYYLSAESVALFADHLPNRPSYIIGRIVHIERQIVKSPPSMPARSEHLLTSDAGKSQLTLTPGSTSNPYGLPIRCEYFIVTVAMLPDTTIHSSPAS